MPMLTLTCPACQHAWELDAPAIPWRALPASTSTRCPACGAYLRVRLWEEGERHLCVTVHEVFKREEDTPVAE